MARRIENECAWCAEEIFEEQEIVGSDRKVYCSATCAQSGETLSDDERRRLMRVITPRNERLTLSSLP
ncbi:MAG: hypothetical protein SF339_28960 [Blastocatellia bacterium]|nr:hypothetical protein [Blastocatellia bacterium]